MNYLVLSVTGLLGLLSFVFLYSKWKHSFWSRQGVPQLNPEFFFGDTKKMVTGDTSLAETFLDIYKRFRSVGAKFGGVYIVFREVFVPIAPELIKDIMQKNFEHFTAHFPVYGTTVLNKGLFHLGGESWRLTRKQLTPTFTSGKMKMMFETMMEKTTGLETLITKFTEESKGPLNIKDILTRFTSDVVGSCGFGIDCNAMNDQNSEFLKNGRMIFDPPATKESYWGYFLRAFGVRRFRRDMKPIEAFFKRIVGDTIDYREKNQVYRKDFMHLMIQLKNRGVVSDDGKIFGNTNAHAADKFDQDYITAQCLIFFIAGFETSATTMTFALLELSQNQELQDKVRQEANEVLKKYNGKMTYDAMTELVYTEKVILETLRKYPPVAVIPRVCTRDYTIPETDIIIKKGTTTQIPAWGLHMDPEYFPDPKKFDPERFDASNKANIKDFTYIPFGEGPRMCIGMRFGIMQSKVGLVAAVRNFKFTLSKRTPYPITFQRDAFISAVDGDVWVDIEKV